MTARVQLCCTSRVSSDEKTDPGSLRARIHLLENTVAADRRELIEIRAELKLLRKLLEGIDEDKKTP